MKFSLFFLMLDFFYLEKYKPSHFPWYVVFQSTLSTADENLLPIAVTVITLGSLIPNIVEKKPTFSNLKFLKSDFVKRPSLYFNVSSKQFSRTSAHSNSSRKEKINVQQNLLYCNCL